MPDFLISDGRALEIKASEFIDVHALRRNHGGARVGGCDSLGERRGEALPQLGLDPCAPADETHLVERTAKTECRQ